MLDNKISRTVREIFLMLDNKFTRIIIAICFVFAILFAIDISQLTHFEGIGKVADKWHEESCVPIFNSDGSYLSESCGDDYTIVLLIDGRRIEERVFGAEFRNFKVGNLVSFKYDIGRLNGRYNQQIDIFPVRK